MTPQSPAPVAGRPLTAEDVSLLRKGDVLRRRDGTVVTLMMDGLPDASWGEIFIGRPDSEGWIPWSGGENPVPGQRVDVRLFAGTYRNLDADCFDWKEPCRYRLSRPASEQPVEAIGAGREVREVVVKAIAFLRRDVGTDRITETIVQLLPALERADAILREKQ